MKNIWQQRFTIRIITITFFIVCILLLRNVFSIWSATHQPKTNLITLEAESEKNRQLKEEIKNWNEDFQKELVIREELNMQKENEIILQVPPLPSFTPNPLPTPTPTPSSWQEWSELLL